MMTFFAVNIKIKIILLHMQNRRTEKLNEWAMIVVKNDGCQMAASSSRAL